MGTETDERPLEEDLQSQTAETQGDTPEQPIVAEKISFAEKMRRRVFGKKNEKDVILSRNAQEISLAIKPYGLKVSKREIMQKGAEWAVSEVLRMVLQAGINEKDPERQRDIVDTAVDLRGKLSEGVNMDEVDDKLKLYYAELISTNEREYLELIDELFLEGKAKETVAVMLGDSKKFHFGHFLAPEDLNAIYGGVMSKAGLHTTLKDAIGQVERAALLDDKRRERLIGELKKIASEGKTSTLSGELDGVFKN